MRQAVHWDQGVVTVYQQLYQLLISLIFNRLVRRYPLLHTEIGCSYIAYKTRSPDLVRVYLIETRDKLTFRLFNAHRPTVAYYWYRYR